MNIKFSIFIVLLVWLPWAYAFTVIEPEAAVQNLTASGFRFKPYIGIGISAPIPPISEPIIAELLALDGEYACDYDSYNAAYGNETTGKLVLVERGVCIWDTKGANVQQAGGRGVIGYNNAERVPFLMTGTAILNIVVVSITMEEAKLLMDLSRAFGTLKIRMYQNPVVEAEKQALKDLYNTANGPNWNYGGISFSDWETDTDPCKDIWTSVSCTPEGNIAQLSLTTVGLSGSIPASFSVLTNLVILDFTNNNLHGTIPEFFNTFVEMEFLQMGSNQLEGALPSNLHLLTKLKTLELSSNRLQGTVDPRIFQISQLEEVFLQQNLFTGAPLPNIFTSVYLASLDLSGNSFSQNLASVDFSSLNTSRLISINLAQNLFEGEISAFSGASSTSLSILNLGNNRFTGGIPEGFADFSSLSYLDISNNSFSGEVVAEYLPGTLRTLIAHHNQYSSLSAGMILLSNLVSVDFSYNAFSGAYSEIIPRLPTPTGDLDVIEGKCLQFIDFSHNQIVSTEPFFYLTADYWPNLISFKINDNLLSGEIIISGIDNTYLVTLDLSNNQFSGALNNDFSRFSTLTNFRVTGNNFRSNIANGVYLPNSFSPDYMQTTLMEDGTFSCPTITMANGAVVVEMDNQYFAYELCHCEPNYRRRVNDNANYTLAQITGQRQFSCIRCDVQAMECRGKEEDARFIIKPNYYPTPTAEDPVSFLDCPSCSGTNVTTGEFKCAEHHSLRLCSKCEDGYFLRGNSCQSCSPVGSTIIIVSIVVLVFLVIGFTMLTLLQRQLCGACFKSDVDGTFFGETPSSSSDIPLTTTLASSGSLSSSQSQSNDHADLVKPKVRVVKEGSVAALLIAINFYQTVSALSQYHELPISVSQLLSAVKVVTSVTGSGLGLECLHSKLQEYKYLYTAIMLEPVLCIGAVLLIYVLGKLYVVITRHRPIIFHEWEITCAKMLFFVINLLFFPISSAAINAFRCEEDPETKINYNSAYPYSECDAIPTASRVIALVFYSIGVIALFSGLIFYYIRKSGKGESGPGTFANVIQKSFGFFFLHFRDRYFWFAIIILLRRFIISLITSLVPVNSVLAFGLNNLVLVVSAFVVLVKKPFKTHIDNLLECTTILCCIFIYGAAVLMAAPGFTYGAVTIEVFYFLVNAIVLIWCAVEFIRTNLPTVLSFFKKDKDEKDDKESL